jgi:hypothetical protein
VSQNTQRQSTTTRRPRDLAERNDAQPKQNKQKKEQL